MGVPGGPVAGGSPNPYVSSYELSPHSATQGGRARPNGEKFNPWSFLANFFFSNMNFAIADQYRHGKARADNFLNKFGFWGSGGPGGRWAPKSLCLEL